VTTCSSPYYHRRPQSELGLEVRSKIPCTTNPITPSFGLSLLPPAFGRRTCGHHFPFSLPLRVWSPSLSVSRPLTSAPQPVKSASTDDLANRAQVRACRQMSWQTGGAGQSFFLSARCRARRRVAALRRLLFVQERYICTFDGKKTRVEQVTSCINSIHFLTHRRA